MGSPESLESIDFHQFVIISSVEWDAWEAPNHWKYIDFMHFA